MELLVVVAVITIITAFILFNQQKFDSSTLLRSLAYSVALSMRQAQLYGVSVLGTTQSGATSFAPGYGVYFSADTQHYQIFADLNGDGARASGGSEDTVPLTIGTGYSISKFCAIGSGGAQDCYPTGSGGTLASLTVYFKRPNPDATFSAQCTGTCAPSYISAYVQVKSNGGSDTRAIKITNTGQITVCPLNTAPPNC